MKHKHDNPDSFCHLVAKTAEGQRNDRNTPAKKKKAINIFFLAYNSTLYFQTLYSGVLRSDLLVYKAMDLSALVIHAELVPCPYVPRQIRCPRHNKVF